MEDKETVSGEFILWNVKEQYHENSFLFFLLLNNKPVSLDMLFCYKYSACLEGIRNLPLLLQAFHAVSQQPLNIVHIIAGISNLPLLLLAFRAVSQQPVNMVSIIAGISNLPLLLLTFRAVIQ